MSAQIYNILVNNHEENKLMERGIKWEIIPARSPTALIIDANNNY